MKRTFILLLLALSNVSSFAQEYRNSSLSTDQRVSDLLSRMTREEKFWQLFMIPGDLGENPSRFNHGIFGLQVSSSGLSVDATEQMLLTDTITDAYAMALKINQIQRYFVEESRLGIPIIPFDEALHGLVREGATAFPQAIGLAATWNPELVHQVAEAIASECRSRGIRQVLSPVVNIASDVRWGRTEETYGEDPFLVSEMGVAFVSAFEKNAIITTPKHFIANVGDGGRDSYSIHANLRLLKEIHLPPFEACIKAGGSRSVMTAYNSYDGTPCTASDLLLNRILRQEWGFRGFVISDAGATGGANVLHMTASGYEDATVKSMEAGLDVVFQTAYEHKDLFIPPFLDGRIADETIDSAVARVLRMKFELGLFEQPYVDPALAERVNGNQANKALAAEAARQSIVLLKNADDILPLAKNDLKIAVIGPDAVEARLGGYSGPGNNKVSILDGIRRKVGADCDVRYARGFERDPKKWTPVPSEFLSCKVQGTKQPGLFGEYFNNVTWSGAPAVTRIDANVDYQWTLYSPDPEKLPNDFYSVRWTGKITAPKSGEIRIGIDGNDGYRLYIDGKLLIDRWIKRTADCTLVEFDFKQGREYDLRIEYYEPVGNARIRLVWDVGISDGEPAMKEALALVSRSDIAIVVAGIEEGEFRDRARLSLPGRQAEMIRRASQTGTPVVVLLVGGSAVTMQDWYQEADAILDVWYPGEMGGDAVADVLFGDYNPAGRLPITFPVSEGQLPLVYNHKPTGRGDDYLDLTGQPLFPFGFGLSYTSFGYSDLSIFPSRISAKDSCTLSFTLTNTGMRAGDEVVQLYIRDELASLARPVTELKGFQRLHLLPGERKQVEFTITPDLLRMLDKDMNWVVEPGDFRIMVGSSSKDIRLRGILNVK